MLVPFVVFLCESGIKQTSCSLKILFRLDISYSAKFSRRIFFSLFLRIGHNHENEALRKTFFRIPVCGTLDSRKLLLCNALKYQSAEI